jgi:hypothetical protein
MFAPFDEIEEAIGPSFPVPAPADIIGGIDGVISQAAASMDEDDVAVLMGVATTDGNAKAAFVLKTEHGLSAVLWFERKDGHNAGGVGVMKTWKRR